jgi:hypothetical protein
MYLDYSLKTPKERLDCVNKVLEETPAEKKTSRYLQYLSDYLLFITEKNQTKIEKKEEHPVTTKNREVTINKRQISYEQVAASLENGEDGLHALINNDKNQLLDNKDKITEKDIKEIPGLKEQLDLIEKLKNSFEKASGSLRFQLKTQIIEAWQQIYILKSSSRGAPVKGRASNQIKAMANMKIPEKISLREDGTFNIESKISLLKPEHISFLLCYYSQLKQESADNLDSDIHWLLIDLENLAATTLKDKPVLMDLLTWKIDGFTNEEIQIAMEKTHGVTHNEQYYSTLWRKRIPKLLAEQAQKNWLIWHFSNEEYGSWKYCYSCGTYKLAHPLFFSKNTSKDGFYSKCKDCRSKKGAI